MPTIILVKKPYDDEVYCLSTKEKELLVFEDEKKAKKNWESELFGEVSSIRKELYQRTFIVWFEPRIATVNINNVLENSLGQEIVESPFFRIKGKKLDQNFAKEIWGNSEPLVRQLRTSPLV